METISLKINLNELQVLKDFLNDSIPVNITTLARYTKIPILISKELLVSLETKYINNNHKAKSEAAREKKFTLSIKDYQAIVLHRALVQEAINRRSLPEYLKNSDYYNNILDRIKNEIDQKTV